jgi:hypothetical protein
MWQADKVGIKQPFDGFWAILAVVDASFSFSLFAAEM